MKGELITKKGKYNPNGNDLTKSKMTFEAGYKAKQAYFMPDGHEKFSDIILNGGIIELQKRGTLDNGAEYMVVKVYFMPTL